MQEKWLVEQNLRIAFDQDVHIFAAFCLTLVKKNHQKGKNEQITDKILIKHKISFWFLIALATDYQMPESEVQHCSIWHENSDSLDSTG